MLCCTDWIKSACCFNRKEGQLCYQRPLSYVDFRPIKPLDSSSMHARSFEPLANVCPCSVLLWSVCCAGAEELTCPLQRLELHKHWKFLHAKKPSIKISCFPPRHASSSTHSMDVYRSQERCHFPIACPMNLLQQVMEHDLLDQSWFLLGWKIDRLSTVA